MTLDRSSKQPLAGAAAHPDSPPPSSDLPAPVQMTASPTIALRPTPFEVSGRPPEKTPLHAWLEGHMDRLTDFGVNLSTVFFLVLQVPQILKNFQGLDKADAPVRGVAWTGFVIGGFGNLMLCAFFTAGGERAQARVQAIGTIMSFFLVTQVWWFAPERKDKVPTPYFVLVIALALCGLFASLLKNMGTGHRFFARWLTGTTVIGATVLANFVVGEVFAHTRLGDIVDRTGQDISNSVVSLLAFLGACAMVVLKKTTDTTGGILATLLFMSMPVPQLVYNLTDAQKLASFNLLTIYFGTIGNGLGMARALYSRNYIWLIGSSWGCFVGGVLTSITVMIGNSALSETDRLQEWELVFLVGFNIVVIVFSAFLFLYILSHGIKLGSGSVSKVGS